VSVQNAEKDAVQTTVQTDTTLTDLGILSDSANNPVAGSNVKEVLWVAPTRQIGDIAYSPATASVSYPIINSATKDTVVRTLGSSATNVRNNQLFISSSTFDGSILVETVRFDALDSLLSINRFNPSAFDTVESLTIHYSINPGAYAYSGADDRLLGTDRSYAYRFGRILHLSVSLTPTAADSSRQSYSGMIAGKLSLSGNEFGEFSGTIDTGMGLYGVLELNGKKYQVNCDHRYTTTIVEMTH
jgi:hypothetical protein